MTQNNFYAIKILIRIKIIKKKFLINSIVFQGRAAQINLYHKLDFLARTPRTGVLIL